MIELLLEAEGALSVGLLDRAEILYRQVAAADPRNAIAVVGLARVTLERGDEVAALGLARRALAIDPENVSAQRMTQRLDEVLRYRGVEVPDDRSLPATPPPSTATLRSAASPVRPALPGSPEPLAPSRTPDEPKREASTEAERKPSTEPLGQAPAPHPGDQSRSIIDRLLRRRR